MHLDIQHQREDLESDGSIGKRARQRRALLSAALGAAIAAASFDSLLAAERGGYTSPKLNAAPPAEATMALSDGTKLLLKQSNNTWYGQRLDRNGRLLGKVATGDFKLASGRTLRLDEGGRVVYGGVETRSFLQCIDPPDCGG